MTYLNKCYNNNKIKILVENSPNAQHIVASTHTSFTNITYTEIDYKPQTYIDGSKASFVIYSTSILLDQVSNSSKTAGTYRLAKSTDNGNTWVEWGDNTNFHFSTWENCSIDASVLDINFCLDTASWDDTLKLQMQLKLKQTVGAEFNIHKNYQFYDQSGDVSSANNVYKPKVMCWSIK
jgi:hypothetical protein